MQAHNTYSSVMFTPTLMRKVIRNLMEVMPQLMRDYHFDTIVVTGKSGCAIGFALSMMVPDLHVVHIRKGESSHGSMIEGDGHEFQRYAFFDDCISSGATAYRVEREIAAYLNARPHLTKATRVLNILYSDTYGRGGLTDGRACSHDHDTYYVPHNDYLPAEFARAFQF